jgi:hypothetical protein
LDFPKTLADAEKAALALVTKASVVAALQYLAHVAVVNTDSSLESVDRAVHGELSALFDAPTRAVLLKRATRWLAD